MKDEASLIEPYLFIDHENIYNKIKQKFDSLNIVIDRLSKIKAKLEKCNGMVENIIMKDKLPSFDKEELFYELLIIIKNTLENSFKENEVMINNILIPITSMRDLIKTLFVKYEEFFNIKKKFICKLVEIEENKNRFLKTAEKAELYTYDFLARKIHNEVTIFSEFTQKEELQKKTKEELNKYKEKINEGNEELKSFNEKQKELFKINILLEKSYDKTYADSIKTYINHQTKLNNYFQQIKQKNSNNDMDINNKKYEENEENEKKEKKEINFVQYQTNIDFHECKNDLDLYTYFMVFDEMEKYIGKYTEDEYLTEQQKIQVKEKIDRILHLDEKITDKDYEELEGYLKNDLGQKLFLNLLSLLRTSGKYEKSKIFIELMGKALNMILVFAEKEVDYGKAKNCLILSQTFFYYDLNKEKKYIITLLTDNKWFKEITFWREFIDLNIRAELGKLKNINDQRNNKNLNDQRKNNILLTQISPFINNMKDFNIDEGNIVKIVDEFIEKYNLTDEDTKNTLYSLINTDLTIIEGLRKEYKNIDNESLEQKINLENSNNNENTIEDNENKNK